MTLRVCAQTVQALSLDGGRSEVIGFINEGVRSALLHPGAVCSNGFFGMERSYRSHKEGRQGSHLTGTPLTAAHLPGDISL